MRYERKSRSNKALIDDLKLSLQLRRNARGASILLPLVLYTRDLKGFVASSKLIESSRLCALRSRSEVDRQVDKEGFHAIYIYMCV